MMKKKKQKVEHNFEPGDPFDAEIPIGALCTRSGCKAVFMDESSRTEPCLFHPGGPLFHEGCQGWTCCKRKTMVFDDFLNFEGCTTDRHKFIPTKKPEVFQRCKFNWYQSATSLIIDLYVKQVDSTKSTVIFFNNRFTVSFALPEGKEYSYEYKLAGEIKPEQSTFAISRMKVLVTLVKQKSKDWPGVFVD